MRPYSSNSAWNTASGAQPSYDPNSNQIITTLGFEEEGGLTSDASPYSSPVYFVDSNTPRWDIPCTRYNCTVVKPGGTISTSKLLSIPIPDKAEPSFGSDAQMIVIDKNTLVEHDLWRARRTSNG